MKTENKNSISIFAIVLSLTAFAISSNSIPPLITTIAAHLSENFQNMGIVVMIQFFSFFVAAFIGGLISQKYSIDSKKLTLIGLMLTGLTLLCGFCINSLMWLKLWAIPLGLGGGLVETFGSIMIVRYEKPNSSKLLNLSQVFFCIGAIAAPQLVSLILYLAIPWKFSFILFSLIILVIAILFFLFAKNKVILQNPDDKAPISECSIFKDLIFYLFAAALLIYVTFESMFVCWIAVYFQKGLFCPAHTSVLRLSVFWFGLIIGRFSVSVLPSRLTFWPVMFCGIVIMMTNSFFACFITSPVLATILVFFIGLGSGPLWPTTVAICHSARNSVIFTSMVIAAGALGAVFGSWLGSAVISNFGFSSFFPTIMISSVLLLLVSIIAYRKA